MPGRPEQNVSFDIRDVPPANGAQSWSLHSALRYTRVAYSEWTGEEALALEGVEGKGGGLGGSGVHGAARRT